MIRFYFLFAFALLAPVARADDFPLPPGFTESVVTDAASGREVLVITGGKRGAPTVVLIHGLGQRASNDWLPVLPALAKDYQVLMLDLPGFGASARSNTILTPKKYADLVHWVIARHRPDPVFVVGHSLGAAVALRHSHDYPQQVRRLLLIDAAGILQTTVFARYLIKVPEQVTTTPVLGRLAERGSRLVNRVSGRFQDLTADNAGTLAALAGSDRARGLLYKDNSNINAALGLTNEDFSPFIRDLKVPVWLLWGEQDPVAPLRTGQALQWLLPQSHLKVLSEVGHVPMSDASYQTGEWMLKSLTGPLPQTRVDEPGASQGDAVCKDQDKQIYRGAWRSIRLEHCANVRIENATVGQLVAIRSTVSMDNVSIRSQGTALEARGSNIAATGLRIVAPRAWKLDNSRLDLAALAVSARDLGDETGGSLIYLSLGHWCDGVDEWRLHGVWKPREGQLDPQFRKVREARCAPAP
ncbi:MAG: alpha/beta hydrolase [Pseudomonadota bacterium]